MKTQTITQWKSIMAFLGEVLGDHCEIVLNVVDGKDMYIAHMVNNHVSGRTLSSPVTSFASKIMTEQLYKERAYVTNYTAKTGNGHKYLRGATYFIKNDCGELEGLLCINCDTSEYEEVIYKLINMGHIDLERLSQKDQKLDTKEPLIEYGETIEVLSSTIQETVGEIIDVSLLSDGIHLNQAKKIEIVSKLNDRGVFQLKGSVAKVAEILNVSEPSIYRYLKKIENQ